MGPGQAKGPAQPGVDPQAFAETLISDKVLKRYGPSFAPATGDMQAIARAGQHLQTHRAAQFANAVDQFYSALGRSTDHLEGKTKKETVEASVSAMRKLVETFAGHAALMPAMATLSSLLEPRGKVDVAPAQHAEAARTTVAALVDSLDGRQGAVSMLFGFRNMVEAYESGQADLSARARPAVWAAVGAYLEQVVPRAGCDQGELGRVAGLFHRALRQTPQDPVGALQRAQASAFETLAAPREAARIQLQQPAGHLAEGSPAHQAHQVLTGALVQVLADNPAGPARLIEAVEALHGQLQPHLPGVVDAARLSGYQAIAQVITLASKTPAAQTLLAHLGQYGAQVANHDGATKILARAARVQNPESLAPILLESHLALIGQDPEQRGLSDALVKLKRLPAGPALNAALTLLPHIGGAEAGPLAEALFVESRVAETPEALADFANRFVTAHAQLRAQLGDEAAAVATALAKNGSGPLAAQVAQRTGALCAGVRGIAPNTPLSKLLDRGKDGSPGLLQLADKGAFIHDPEPLLYDLLRAVTAQAGARDALPEARLALAIAGQLAFFDREPRQSDFPKILEDFSAALADPKLLHAAPVEGGAAAVKVAKNSVSAFASAHSSLPVELVFTAGRALDSKQMGWLQKTLGSSRSHAFGRALRDAVFAAVKMGRADFITALSQPNIDTKTLQKTANFVAMEHRQNHADAVPFDRLIEGLAAGQDPVATIANEKAAKALEGLNLDGIKALSPTGMAQIEKSKAPLQALMGFFDQVQYNAPPGHFLPHLHAVVRGHADGTWPSYKYTNDAAKEHLAGLSPEQVAVWSSEMVTGKNAPVAADDPGSLEAMELLRGVAAKLHRSVDLKGPGFEDVGWSQASLAKLRQDQGALLDQLRNSKKGSKAHRAGSASIGPIQARVALLELHLALKETFQADPGPAQAVLTRIKPLALGAMSALRQMGQPGFVDALDTAAAATKAAPTQLKQGKYAADEDQIESYLTSFDRGSCINPSDGFNRGALVEMMGGSQYKMIRAMDGDKSVGRAFLRLIKTKLPNGYEGHAIAMDTPKNTPSGHPGGEDSQLMYEHALAKAVAMGVPLLVHDQTVLPAAQARGLQLENMQCAVSIHKGITGMHHNEGLNGGDYFINWPGMAATPRGYDVPNDDMKYADRNYGFQVVMPPGWKKA